MKMAYNDRKTKLYRANFSMEKLKAEHVSFWNVAPVWPGRGKAKLTEKDLSALLDEAYSRSADHAHMVLWMPASELHISLFDPMGDAGPWLLQATVLSGSHPLHIGFVYSRSRPKVDWDTKFILDTNGRRGPSSALTMKFLLSRLGDTVGTIVDPFAHKSAALPIWARRFGIRYVGYQASKRSYASMVKTLAQVELPGIQLEVPA